MTIKQKPFTKYRFDEERSPESREIISVSLNNEERAWLNEIMEQMGILEDGKALKFAAFIGKNVIQTLVHPNYLRKVLSKKRPKKRDRKSPYDV